MTSIAVSNSDNMSVIFLCIFNKVYRKFHIDLIYVDFCDIMILDNITQFCNVFKIIFVVIDRLNNRKENKDGKKY